MTTWKCCDRELDELDNYCPVCGKKRPVVPEMSEEHYMALEIANACRTEDGCSTIQQSEWTKSSHPALWDWAHTALRKAREMLGVGSLLDDSEKRIAELQDTIATLRQACERCNLR
jgi:hypothetical protein